MRQCGIVCDYIFNIAALHDILEDTATTKEELFDLLRSGQDDRKCLDIIVEVELLTHKRGEPFEKYINRIFQDDSIKRESHISGPIINGAKIVKLADRIHNISTLHLCGDVQKIQRKIRQTEDIIMPLRSNHPDCEKLFAKLEEQLELLNQRLPDLASK